jgi:hypothetical protein
MCSDDHARCSESPTQARCPNSRPVIVTVARRAKPEQPDPSALEQQRLAA